MSKKLCENCDGQGWVCENHPDRPWGGASHAVCECGGAGAPCERCNPCDRENPPRMAPGTTVMWTAENGWSH